MLAVLYACWESSWLVRQIESFAHWLVAVFRGWWPARWLDREWDDQPPHLATSRLAQIGRSLGQWLTRLRLPADWLVTSWFLAVLPHWLVSDLTWVWETSLLGRLWRKFWAVFYIDKSLEDTSDAPAPPIWRLSSYLLAGGLLVWVFLSFEWGRSLLLLAGAAVTLLLIWGRPDWGLYLVVALIPLVPALINVALILFSLLARLLQGKLRLPQRSLLAFWGGLFCLTLLLSALNSRLVLAALHSWSYQLAGLLLFLQLPAVVRDRTALNRLLALALTIGILVSGLGIWQYFGGMPAKVAWVDLRYSSTAVRVVGSFDNPNVFGVYLIALLAFAVSQFLAREGKWLSRLLAALVSSVLGLALIMTFSRGAWLGAIAIAIVLVASLQPKLFWLLPPALLVLPLIVPEAIWNRLLSAGNLNDSSIKLRFYIWGSSLRMFRDNWLTGIGPGYEPFALHYPPYRFEAVHAIHAHNLPLQQAVEGGVPGLGAFALLAIGLVRACLSRRQGMDALSAGVLAALIGHLVYGLFDYAWYGNRLLLLFWLLAALALITWRRRPRPLPSEEKPC